MESKEFSNFTYWMDINCTNAQWRRQQESATKIKDAAIDRVVRDIEGEEQ